MKRRANDERRTQTSVIEEAIRRLLREEVRVVPRPMPTFGDPENNALLVELEDKEAVYRALDGEAAA